MPNHGDLRVWWIPQVPGKPFHVSVPDLSHGKLLVKTLADYDASQFKNRIKPDYCNAGGIEIFEDGEWISLDEDEDDAEVRAS